MEKDSLSHVGFQRPQIRKFINVLDYLKEHFRFRKFEEPTFSLESWSIELGFKSRSFMYMICSGKRTLTPQFVERFSRSLGYSQAEKDYLLLLSFYHKAKSASQKSLFFNRILESMDVAESDLAQQHVAQFLSCSTLPKIQLALSFDDFLGTADEISKLFNITSAQAEKYLLSLEKLGTVKAISDGRTGRKTWESNSRSLVVREKLKDEAINIFHQRTAKEMQSILQTDDRFQRFRSIFFAVSDDELSVLLEEIENFLTKLKNSHGDGKLLNKRLVKLNVQAYAASEKLEGTVPILPE